MVPVVTTAGSYSYVGRLIAGFDKDGNLVSISEASGPVRVAGGSNPDATEPHPMVKALVTDPVQAAVDGLAANIIASSEVALDGVRGDVRSRETNEGNLIADALRWQAAQVAASFGLPSPDVGIQNGGGIRNDNIIPAGPISELNTWDMVPFSNFVSIVPSIPRVQFKEILENAVSHIESDLLGGTGRFAQLSGISIVYDVSVPAMSIDLDGTVLREGTRILSAILDDGTVIVEAGNVVAGDPITVATIDFLVNGGDQYPYRGAEFTRVGFTYQQAVFNYLVDGLSGVVSAASYPEGGEGRITKIGSLSTAVAAN
jgi:5'-nucleotidase